MGIISIITGCVSKQDWQKEIDTSVRNMSNENLLQATLDIAGGDDYEGCFTKRGRYLYDACYSELTKRLARIGFIRGKQ